MRFTCRLFSHFLPNEYGLIGLGKCLFRFPYIESY